MKKISFLLALTLLFLPALAGAFDYKSWIPALPKTLGNMALSGAPEGMNMDSGGQKWSSLSQEYRSKDGKKTAHLAVIGGQMAPQVMGFQSMVAMNMNMDTGDQVIKTVQISGNKALVVVEKQDKSGTLTIPVSQDTVVAVTLEPANSPNELINLAKSIPLSKFGK